MAALIDADIISYIAASVAQDSTDWGDGDLMVTADLDKAKRTADDTIAAWHQPTGEDDFLLCWSDRTCKTFRYGVHPHYKAQRTGAKPVLLKEVEAYMHQKYESVVFAGLEGDDVIGLMMTDPDRGADVAVSTDKDLKTIPGRLYVPGKSQRPGMVRQDRADWWWMTQVIVGDPSDNFKGAPGAGAKAAAKALDDRQGAPIDILFDAVLAVFELQNSKSRWQEKMVHPGEPWEEAVMNARCARILRHGDYNHPTGKVTLWTP